MRYLHIGQHWRKTVMLDGITYVGPKKLTNLSQVVAMSNTPLKENYKINNDKFPQWGEEVYSIDENNDLTFVTASYDTSD